MFNTPPLHIGKEKGSTVKRKDSLRKAALRKQLFEDSNGENSPLKEEGDGQGAGTSTVGDFQLPSKSKPPSHVSSRTTSSTRQRKQLELEAAQAKAKIELEIAETKGRLEKELIEKKLALDLEDLSCNQSQNMSEKSIQSKKKVERWLKNQPGTGKQANLTFDFVGHECADGHSRQSGHGDGGRENPSLHSNIPPEGSSSSADSNEPSGSGGFGGSQNRDPGPARGSDPVTTLALHKDGIAQLADVFRDAMNMAASTSKLQSPQLLTRLATSKDLPVYYGDPLEWLKFKEAFHESTKLCKYSQAENVWRLRKCLRGEAKEAVASILIGSTTPDFIMETLELKFGRPETIMLKIMTQMKKLQPLPQAYHTEIINFAIKIKNYVAAAHAINETDCLRSPELVNLVLSKFPTILLAKWSDFYYVWRNNSKAKLETLAEFLHQEATKAATTGISHIQNQPDFRRKPEEHRRTHSINLNVHSTERKYACKFCRGTKIHTLENCSRFKRALRKDRWRYVRIHKLCYKCLSSHQFGDKSCGAPDCSIESCGQPHHTLLHWTKPGPPQQVPVSSSESADAPPPSDDEQQKQCETVANAVSSLCERDSKVLLKIVPVDIHGPNGKIRTYALLDDGSTVTLISSRLADAVGLHGKCVTMRARSAWDTAEIVCEVQLVKCDISNNNGELFSLSACKMRELSVAPQIIPKRIDVSEYGRVSASYELSSYYVQPELVIGQDNFHLLAPLMCLSGKKSEPYFTKTPLGWCLHGSVCKNINTITADRFFTPINNAVGEFIYNYGSYTADDLSYVSLAPVSLFTIVSGDDAHAPSPSLQSSALADDDSFAVRSADEQLYEFVRKSYALDSIGIISKPRVNPDDLRAYIILSNTSELVNGFWFVGLPWKNDDFTMPNSYLNAFRRFKSVERKMEGNEEFASRYKERVQHLLDNDYARELTDDEYLNEDDSHVWYLPHFGVDNPYKKKMRLVYDAAAKTNGYSLNDFLLQGPDLLQSLLGIMLRFRENRVGIIADIQDMFLRIKIRKQDQHALRFLWRSNPADPTVHKYVMNSLIFGANCSPYIAQFINQYKNTERFRDMFPDAVNAFQRSQYMDDYIDSLNDEASAVQMIKDISHINQAGGFQMRNWLSNSLSALENAPKEILNDKTVRFNVSQFERTLGLLWFPATDLLAFDLSFKRIPGDITNLQRKPTKREMLRIIMSIYDIHGFLGPLMVKAKILLQKTWKIELKWDNQIPNDLFQSFREWFMQLKAVDNIRIPRWYFLSESLSDSNECELDGKIRQGICVSDPILELHIFCDASPCAYAAVAYWRKQYRDGSVHVSFIASKNRVAPIKQISVPRLELQGALIACRLAETIKKEHRITPSATFYWTDSTTVLYWIKNQSKNYKMFIAHRLGEIDSLSNVDEWNYVPSNLNIADLATKINDYKLTSDCEWFSGPSFLRNLDEYRALLIPETEIKGDETQLEIINVINIENRDLPVPDSSRFSSWLRLLRTTALVISFINKCRNKPFRVDCKLMKQAEILIIRQPQYDSFGDDIDLLKTNKTVGKTSRLLNLTPFLDEKGILRVGGRINAALGVDTGHHTCPFTSCGVDLFGPMDVTVGRRREKRYGVLFTCMTVRAVHIELVPSLTADSFIMALRRMAARRGWPRLMHSDNGTNLRGADTELSRSFCEIDQDAIAAEATNSGIDWRFISPLSPHMAGAWERLIRTVKTALKVVLKERAPRDEVLSTLMAEVENIVNSRPLSHVSVDPHSDEALTPNHFLLGSSFNLPVPGVFDDGELYSRRQWRIAQSLTDLFWSRWMKEVLPALLPRQKWRTEGQQLKVGDLVVVVDPNSPRNAWPKGIIETVHSGKDGRVRVVDIKTRFGVMKRPAVRVALLFREDECRLDNTAGEDVNDTC